MDQLFEFLSKLKEVLSSFSPAKKFSLAAAALIAFAGIGLVVYWSGQVGYRVLFSNLSNEDADSIVGKLQENVVGKDRAVVRVSADMDFSVTEQTEEKYDPESPVVRSVKRMTDKTAFPAAAAAAANAPEHEKSDETTNYEINRVVSKTVLPVGVLKKISVAALIDGVYTKNEKGVDVYQPRAQKDIDSIAGLVQRSVGINSARGDQLVVTAMPFSKVELAEDMSPVSTWREKVSFFFPMLKYFLAFIAVIVLIVFFVRPLLRDVISRDALHSPAMQTLSPGAAPVEDTVHASTFSEGFEQEKLSDRDIARKLAEEDSRKFAEVLKTWLK
jgi:flagellar M-ring protein FliF